MPRQPRVGIVIDALSSYRGAERVLAAVLELFPGAPVHTLVYERDEFAGTRIADHPVHTSFIQRLPGARRQYRNLLPLLPRAIEGLEVGDYDIVLSFSYAVAHGIRCRPDQLHISYTFAPLRYAWQDEGEYFQRGPVAPLARLIMQRFRPWDREAAGRINHFVAISNWTKACIRRAYQREAEVIYPPVEIECFGPMHPRGDYFVAFSRLVRHKRLEVIVEAFSRLGLPLVLIGDGPERRKLEARAGANIRFVGTKSSEEAAALLGRARALVHAAEEDFGLVLAEAQAAGCPVIAYRGGAAPEIVTEGKTGVLFAERNADSLIAAIRCFLSQEGGFDERECISNVQRFRKECFQAGFGDMVQREWSAFAGERVI